MLSVPLFKLFACGLKAEATNKPFTAHGLRSYDRPGAILGASFVNILHNNAAPARFLSKPTTRLIYLEKSQIIVWAFLHFIIT